MYFAQISFSLLLSIIYEMEHDYYTLNQIIFNENDPVERIYFLK